MRCDSSAGWRVVCGRGWLPLAVLCWADVQSVQNADVRNIVRVVEIWGAGFCGVLLAGDFLRLMWSVSSVLSFTTFSALRTFTCGIGYGKDASNKIPFIFACYHLGCKKIANSALTFFCSCERWSNCWRKLVAASEKQSDSMDVMLLDFLLRQTLR